MSFYQHSHPIYGLSQVVIYELSHQLHRALLAGVVGAQFAAEGTGEDGFFCKFNLLQHLFGGLLGLLLFGENAVEDADNFGLLFN